MQMLRTSVIRTRAASRSTTSPSRTCRRASGRSHLFRLANLHNALVVGTSDLSELALGWCTYGVGDQMSHYAVNASVPKTLIQHLVRWLAASARTRRSRRRYSSRCSEPRSAPELIPGAAAGSRRRAPRAIVGPYELQDFNLYYISAASAFVRARLHFWRSTPGARVRAAHGRTSLRDLSAASTIARDQALARSLPAALLPDESNSSARALPNAPEGRLRRIALAAQRLARSERQRGDGVARGARLDPRPLSDDACAREPREAPAPAARRRRSRGPSPRRLSCTLR